MAVGTRSDAGDERVWITINWRSDNDVYHTSEVCPRLPDDEAAYDDVGRGEVPDQRACQGVACEGEGGRTFEAQDCPVCGEWIEVQLGIHLRTDCDGGASA